MDDQSAIRNPQSAIVKVGDFMALEGNTPIFSDLVSYYSNPCLANEGEDLMDLNDGEEAEDFHPTHVQVIVRVNPEIPLGKKDSVIVVSCDPNGAWCRSVRPEEWDSRWRIMTLKPGHEFTEEGLQNARKFCFSTIRSGYDYPGCFGDFTLDADLQDAREWFCSEHVFMFYWFGGRPLQERLKAAFVKPRDCYVSPIVTIAVKSEGLIHE